MEIEQGIRIVGGVEHRFLLYTTWVAFKNEFPEE